MNQLQTNTVEFPLEVRIASTSNVHPTDEPADNGTLMHHGEKAAAILRNAPGVAMTQTDRLNEAPQLKLNIDPDRANFAGLGNADIARTAQTAANGVQVSTLQYGNKQIHIVARVNEDERATLSDLQNLYVSPSNAPQKIPIRSVLNLERGLGMQQVLRPTHCRT